MKTSILLDTNILIDMLGTGPFYETSQRAVLSAFGELEIVLSAIVWAELALPNIGEGDLYDRLAWMRPRREPFPFAAAYTAGRAHRLYRERGGRRERTLPDFLIGAHALVAGHRLLTRDAARYRGYFQGLDIVSPEEAP